MTTTVGPARKVYTDGTHRARLPEDTWSIMEPKLATYGVTRVSDVTGLDALGIPVAMASRPAAWTVSVSQGKGRTLTLARVSAVMECIELWHAERSCPPVTHRDVPAHELDLPYSVTSLGVERGPFVSDATPLDWVDATGLVSGRTVPVPRAAVMFPDPRVRVWTPGWIQPSSNGLASGNVRSEAALHALYEIIERHVLALPSDEELERVPAIDPTSIPDETCLEMVRLIESANGRILVQALPNDFGIPTFRVLVWSWDFPLPIGGYGSHSDPVVAVSRAVTESAQGRLAAIVGSRDDLEDYYTRISRPQQKAQYLSSFSRTTTSFEEQTPVTSETRQDITEELEWLARRTRDVVGQEPLMVDLSSDPDFSVVKVIVPGAAFEGDRVHSRLERPA